MPWGSSFLLLDDTPAPLDAEEVIRGEVPWVFNPKGLGLLLLKELGADGSKLREDVAEGYRGRVWSTEAEVYGVVSFYHDFRCEPPGLHVLRLCRAEACQSLGADALAEHVRRRLGVDWHYTTSDGAVTLQPVFCLGLCAVGPSAMLDGAPLGRLDNARIDLALERAR